MVVLPAEGLEVRGNHNLPVPARPSKLLMATTPPRLLALACRFYSLPADMPRRPWMIASDPLSPPRSAETWRTAHTGFRFQGRRPRPASSHHPTPTATSIHRLGHSTRR